MSDAYHLAVGPCFRHVEEVRYRIATKRTDLIRLFCKRHGFEMPLAYEGRRRLQLGRDALDELGLSGNWLALQCIDGQYSVRYKTSSPTKAKSELLKLLAKTDPDVALGDRTKRYQEIFAWLTVREFRQLQLVLPPSDPTVSQRYQRSGTRLFYAQELRLPSGVKGAIPVAVVVYRTVNSRAPHFVKVEIRGPIKHLHPRPRTLSPADVSHMVGLLRSYLHAANVRASAGPDRVLVPWTGTPFENTHKQGPTHKLIKTILAHEPDHRVSFHNLVEQLQQAGRSGVRSNLRETLRRMEKAGVVTLVTHSHRIASIRLFDYAAITTWDAGKK